MTRPLLRPTPALLLLALSLVGRPAVAAGAPADAASPEAPAPQQAAVAAEDEVLTSEARAEAVREQLDGIRDEASACFEVGREVQQGDRVTLAFVVDPAGQVTDLEVEKSNVDDDAVHACLTELVAALEFPAGDFERIEVEEPFFGKAPLRGGDPVVTDAINAHQDEIQACWDAAIEAGRRPEGELELTWNVAEAGVFEAIKVVSSDLDDEEMEACIEEVVGGIVVEPRSQPIQQTMTWTFSYEDSRLAVYAKESKRWSVSASFGTRAGAMMFHPTDYVRSSASTVMTHVSVNGTWRFHEQVIGYLMLGGAYELTTPNNPEGRRFWGTDPSFGVNFPELYREELTGIRVSGGIGATLGLSDPSRWMTQLGTLGANVGASRSFLDGRLTASLGLNLRSYFHRYTSPVGDPVADDGVELLLARAGGVEDLGDLVAVSGSNPALSTGANLSVHWQLTDRVGANLAFGLGRVWSHTPELDGLSADVTDVNGDPVVDCGGLCPNDMMTGSIGASWRFMDRWSLAGNLATSGAVFAYERIDPENQDGSELSGDSRYARFPFWDPNLSGSSFSLMVSRTF